MTVLEEVKALIEKDKEEKENRYWSLLYFDFSKTLVIRATHAMICTQAIFMGEPLAKNSSVDLLGKKHHYFNSYLLILKQNYPIIFEITGGECRIKYDLKRMRQWKIKKLLNG